METVISAYGAGQSILQFNLLITPTIMRRCIYIKSSDNTDFPELNVKILIETNESDEGGAIYGVKARM